MFRQLRQDYRVALLPIDEGLEHHGLETPVVPRLQRAVLRRRPQAGSRAAALPGCAPGDGRGPPQVSQFTKRPTGNEGGGPNQPAGIEIGQRGRVGRTQTSASFFETLTRPQRE